MINGTKNPCDAAYNLALYLPTLLSVISVTRQIEIVMKYYSKLVPIAVEQSTIQSLLARIVSGDGQRRGWRGRNVRCHNIT